MTFLRQSNLTTGHQEDMTREQTIQKAYDLRDQGASYSEIALALGVHYSTAYGWLNPGRIQEKNRKSNAKRAAAKRDWEREHDRKPCPQCGRPRGIGHHRVSPDGVCQECRLDNEAAGKLARRHRIERLWNLGRTLREIADDLGSTYNSVGTEITHMRTEGGWDVPYRYAVDDAGRSRLPEPQARRVLARHLLPGWVRGRAPEGGFMTDLRNLTLLNPVGASLGVPPVWGYPLTTVIPRITMSYMTPDEGKTITVRLDAETLTKLANLADTFMAMDPLERDVSTSWLVRRAINMLYATTYAEVLDEDN